MARDAPRAARAPSWPRSRRLPRGTARPRQTARRSGRRAAGGRGARHWPGRGRTRGAERLDASAEFDAHRGRPARTCMMKTTRLPRKGRQDMAHSVIIGGSTGIGRVIAQRFADRGDEVVITSRDGATAHAIAREIGPGARGLALDLGWPESIAGA